VPVRAHADADEWRLSVGVGGGMMNLHDSDANGSSVVPGAKMRLGYGLSDAFEVGIGLAVAHGADAEFQNATVHNPASTTQMGTLSSEVLALELGAELRWVADNTVALAFARTHPLVGLRGGFLVRQFNAAYLEGAGGTVTQLDDRSNTLPFVGGTVGVEHRLSHAVAFGLVSDFTYAGSAYRAIVVSLEASWLHY
jgi:hypothetical protein